MNFNLENVYNGKINKLKSKIDIWTILCLIHKSHGISDRLNSKKYAPKSKPEERSKDRLAFKLFDIIFIFKQIQNIILQE